MSTTDAAELAGVGALIDGFGAEIAEGTIGAHAIELAGSGWPVLPLRGKTPAIPKRQGGRGYLDGTTDRDRVIAWWSGVYAGCNIGARIPDPLILVDTDPRKADGADPLLDLAADHGALPATLTVASGRGDGGLHRYYRHPAGALSDVRLPGGVDIKLPTTGLAVVPPSIHPDSGEPYRWVAQCEPAECPRWLVRLMRPAPRPAPAHRWPADHASNIAGRLAGLCRTVAQAAAPASKQDRGNRHDALLWAAHRGAEMVADGADENEIRDALLTAAQTAGLPNREAESVVTYALENNR